MHTLRHLARCFREKFKKLERQMNEWIEMERERERERKERDVERDCDKGEKR